MRAEDMLNEFNMLDLFPTFGAGLGGPQGSMGNGGAEVGGAAGLAFQPLWGAAGCVHSVAASKVAS